MSPRGVSKAFGSGCGVLALLLAPLVATATAAADDHDDGAPTALVEELSTDFEDGATGSWHARGDGVSVELTEAEARSPEHGIVVSGRSADWHGVQADVTDVFEVGGLYEVSAWVKLPDGATEETEFRATVQLTAGEQSWNRIATAADVGGETWVELSGEYRVPGGVDQPGAELLLYIEAQDPEASFLVDDIVVARVIEDDDDDADDDDTDDTEVDPVAFAALSTGFEDVETTAPWGPRGPESVAVTVDEARTGQASAAITERTSPWNGIAADVTELFTRGTTYAITGWVKLPEGTDGESSIRLSYQDGEGDDADYVTITTASGVTAGAWVEVGGLFELLWPTDHLSIYFETVSGTLPFLVDDIAVEVLDQNVDTDLPSIWQTYADDWPVGVAIDERETTGASAELLLHHYNQLTAENHMKPENIEPREGEFTFGAADQLLDFAVANDLTVYGHTLVWHSQTPDWFFEDADGNPLTDSAEHQELLRQRMVTHIHTVADHFRDRYGDYGAPGNPITAYDVVNEAIAENQADGLRRSPWYTVLGEEYLDLAFHTAREAFGPEVALFINDYNSELPAKRQAYYDVVQRLLGRGVPIDGVGHQLHVSLTQPVSGIRATLDQFETLGLEQAVTELDVVISGDVTGEALIEQGHYYAQLFELFAEHDLYAVTIWGLYDNRSWRAEGAPLPFDGRLDAKPAYWGIVDPGELPALVQRLNVHVGDVSIDSAGLAALEWELLPLRTIGEDDDAAGAFHARWNDEAVLVYVEVDDATGGSGEGGNGGDGGQGADDTVEVFIDGIRAGVGRDGEVLDGSPAGTEAIVIGTEGGYTVLLGIPFPGDLGAAYAFDVRITDGQERTSWNDPASAQESGDGLGQITLVEPIGFAEVPYAETAPAIDGEIDEAWADATTVRTEVSVEGGAGAVADVHLLWHGEQLFLLFEVADPSLDASNSNAWEQDSVEIFVDPVNAKNGYFLPEDGQYRVNFRNEVSVSGDLAVIGDRLASGTSETESGYIVEAAIDLGRQAEAGDLLGLELQVNDAADGVRTSVQNWSDPTGRSYQDTLRWGVVELQAGDDGGNGGTPPGETEPSLSVTPEEVEAGGEITVAGIDFEAGATVGIELHSNHVELGEVTVAADGTLSGVFTIPADTGAGGHAVVAVDADGDELARATITVVAPDDGPGGPGGPGGGGPGDGDHGDGDGTTPPSDSDDRLSDTGASVAVPILVALLLAATGTTLHLRRARVGGRSVG